MPAEDKEVLEIFSDYVCPWCYLCTVRVARLRAVFAIETVFRHFPLHPETPNDGLTLEKLFAGRDIDCTVAQARMSRLMAAEGLPFGKRTMTYNSRLAQELGKWAETQPGGEQLHTALFQAYFVDNLNLSREENLIAVAEGVGLSLDKARGVLRERYFRESVDEDWRRSHELGITGVPTFIMGERCLVGAQPYGQLESFVTAAGAVRRP